jgi:hypothetical protein
MKGLSAGGLGANWHRAERIGSRLKANESSKLKAESSKGKTKTIS